MDYGIINCTGYKSESVNFFKTKLRPIVIGTMTMFYHFVFIKIKIKLK